MIGGAKFFSITPVAGVPAPSSLALSSRTDTTIDLSWVNGDATKTTDVERDSSVIANKSAGVTTHSDTGRTQDTLYAYRVRHLASPDNSPYSNTLNVYTLPTAPTLDTVVDDGPYAMDLTWTNANGTAPINIYRDGVFLTQVAAGTTSYKDTGLTQNTLYAYKLRHEGNISLLESADSNTLSDTTDSIGPAGDPSSLVVEANGLRQFGLSWTTGDALAETEVYRDNVLVTTLTAGTNTYNDALRTQGTSYTYKVRHKKDGLYSNYTADNTKTFPNITTLSVAGNNVGDSFDFGWAFVGDFPTGWKVALEYSDNLNLPYSAPGYLNQDTSYQADVSAYYDVRSDGSETPTVTMVVSVWTSADVMFASAVDTTQTVTVEPNPA